MSDKRINVRIWQPIPPPSAGNPWRVDFDDGRNHILVDGATEEAAQDKFCRDYGIARALITWLHEAPPPPRPGRPGDSVPAAPAIEGEADAIKFHRLVLRAFHPDLHGAKRWSANEIIAAINEAWESTRPQERRS